MYAAVYLWRVVGLQAGQSFKSRLKEYMAYMRLINLR